MIIKISARELRELVASCSVPAEGVLGTVTHPVGDGKSKYTMTTTGGGPCFVGADGEPHPYGSDRDVDKKRIETLEAVADFNERAFRRDAGVFARDKTDWAMAKAEADREAVSSLYRESAEAQGDGRRPDRDTPAATPGMLRRMGFPTHCGEPVYADVPPMPSGFLGGVHHDCPAAAFARGFSEAFRTWLDSFDSVVRERRKGEWLEKGLSGFVDRRAVDMEAYAKTDTVAFIRFFEPSNGDGEDGRTLYRKEIVVTNWADVMPLLSSHIDMEVSNLARSLHVDDDGMREVRDSVVRGDCSGVVCPDGKVEGEGDGNEESGKMDEGRTTDVKEGDGLTDREREARDRLERERNTSIGMEVVKLDEALWKGLRVLSESVDGLLALSGRTRRLVVNTIPCYTDGKVIVLFHVKDGAEGWVRSRDFVVGLGGSDLNDACHINRARVAVAYYAGIVLDALFGKPDGNWDGWRERGEDDVPRRCGPAGDAARNDYEQMDVEDEVKRKVRMAEAERAIAEDLCDQPNEIESEKPKKGARWRK